MTILDTYGSALAAVSTRLLRTAYSGACLRLRKSLGDPETDVNFIDGYIDTATLLGHADGWNGLVPKWYDQSGNGNDFLCTENAKQPAAVISGVLQIIGALAKSAVKYTGAGGASYLQTTGTTLADLKDMSIFIVAGQSWNYDYIGLLSIGTPGDDDWIAGQTLHASDGSNLLGLNLDSGGFEKSGTGLMPMAIIEIHNSTTGGTITSKLYYNGSLVGSDTAAESYGDNLKGPLILGQRWLSGALATGYGWDGPIAEIIAWNSNQEANRTAIYDDMYEYYVTGPPPGVPPTVTAGVVSADGLTVTLTFDKAVDNGAGGWGGMDVNGIALTYSSGTGTVTVVFTADDLIDLTWTTLLTYVQPGTGIQEAADPGNYVESFADFGITNNSAVSNDTDIRITQESILAIALGGNANTRLSQEVPLAIGLNTDTYARLSQVVPHSIGANDDTFARTSQVIPVSVGANNDTFARASQIVMYAITDVPAPIAVNDSAYCYQVNTQLVVAAPGVLSNDTVGNAVIDSYTQPVNGSVTLELDGSFTYDPDLGFIGEDTWTYTLVDGVDESTGTVTLNLCEGACCCCCGDRTFSSPFTTVYGTI